MSRKTKTAVLAGAVLGLAQLQPCAKTIPLKDFFRNPPKTGYDVSPDGKFVSFLAPYKRRLNIFVQERGRAKAARISSETDRDITGGYIWKGPDRLVYLKDFKGDENFHLVVVGRDGKGLRDLTPFKGVRTTLVDELKDNDREVLVGLNKRNKELFDVYRLDIVTGGLRLVAENPGNVVGWGTDHEGKLRVAQTSDGVNTTLLYRAAEKAAFKPVLTTTFKERFNPVLFTFDNRRLYAFSSVGRDRAALVEFDPESGKETAVLYQHPDVDVDNLIYSRKRKVLAAANYITWRKEWKFLDAEFERIVRDLEGRLPGREIIFTGHNKAEDVFVVRTYSDRSMGAYYLYETASKTLSKLAERAPWLDEKDLAPMSPLTFQSRDGLTIHGYLTVPLGKEAKSLPVVVNPHGGPWARDVWGFNPEVQFLANRGYAVLQINFRGSTGYGRKFWEASFKQWGKKMQDDVTDGVSYLIKAGIADPRRVAIYGGSYGGYATLAGVTFTPDLYACAVDYVGVSNLFTFLTTIPPYWKPELEMFYEMVGHPEKDKALLREASPVFHVDKIKAPLFVAQGAKDPRVNINESNQIVDALRKKGVKVEYMVKENEGHGFRNEENRFDFYGAMEKFLAKHLKAGK